ncbi:hypothetical protein lerEdw1_001292 [Lerista edwardsae]|nr:hypothetical protein lerEdw1_001292 [Lerista edwardsae]
MDVAAFLEIRRRMQSGLLIIRDLTMESLPMDVSVMPSVIEIKNGQDCKMISLPPEVSLVPSSCRGLHYVPGDGLHLRLLVQASSHAKLVSAVSDSLKSKRNCTFYCQSCGETIIKNKTFLRVLSLPSENWSDLVDEWCCHPNPFKKSLFQPQTEDCFLGHSYFLLGTGSMFTESGFKILPSKSQGAPSENSGSVLNSKTNSRVICKRCKTFLGEGLSSDVTKFYFTELFVQPSEDTLNMIPRSFFIQRTVAQCLIELSVTRSTFRFSIHGLDGTVYILVWLLNSDTLLAESLGNVACSNSFNLFNCGMSSDMRSSEIKDAIKVLFHPCLKSRNKDLVDSWEKDTGVHPLTFPSKTCLELLLILSRSNASLPLSLRWMNSFQHPSGAVTVQVLTPGALGNHVITELYH